MSSSVRCVACTAVTSRAERPESASSSVGVRPCAARQASFSARCSDRWTCSGTPPRPTRPRSPSASAGTARTEWIAAPTTACGGARRARRPASAQRVASPSPKRSCGSLQRLAVHRGRQVEVSSSVIRMPASAAAATSACAHRVRVGVRRAARRVVQIVELADGRDPGQRHLGVTARASAVVASPGRAAAPRAYICSRQVQNEPRPACVRPAAPGGTRASARWPAPAWSARRRPRAAPVGGVARGRGRRPRRIRSHGRPCRSRPPVAGAVTPASAAREPGRASRPVTRVRRASVLASDQHARSCQDVGERLDAGLAVGVGGVFGGGVGDAGGVADEEHRGRDGGRSGRRRRGPAPVGRTGARRGASRGGRAGRRGTRPPGRPTRRSA